MEGFRGRILRKAAEGSIKLIDFFVGRSSRKDLCGRIPRKDFQCGINIKILRKDSAEGFCGRISEGSAEGSSRKDKKSFVR